MQIVVAAVGKLRPSFRQLCDDYARRLGRYTRLVEHEVREAPRAPTAESRRVHEARRLAAKVPPGALIVGLAREGRMWTSLELSREVDRWRIAARPVALVIGGSNGLATDLLARANVRWSLGPLTLPHELARVLVFEQLYRAFSILKGEPYHKRG